jgi:1-acyl-sn-glycerol-3-phosphate acyltransferase
MKRETLQRLVRFLIKTLTHTEYFHPENIPASGPVILAINHMSHIDTPVLFVNPTRPDITALVTTKYKENWFVRVFTDIARGIWIDRDIADFTAIRKASEILAKGWVLGIAPEGTRSKTGEMQEGKPGTIMLALKSGAPIVPVALTGTEDALKKLMRLRRPHITVTFGEPFTLPDFPPRHRSEELHRWIEILMRKIAALLPEKYRGIYS